MSGGRIGIWLIGISLVPEDRKTEALSLTLSGMHNASLPVIDRFTRGPLIAGVRETSAVEAIFERVDVDRRALSGLRGGR